MSASHDYLDHTAELTVRLRADSMGELFAEAGRALAELVLGDRAAEAPAPTGPARIITLTAPDAPALLVDWMNELIFRAETERWIATAFEVLDASETRLRIAARGVELETAPALVKAATLHGLTLRDVDGALQADVVLDV